MFFLFAPKTKPCEGVQRKMIWPLHFNFSKTCRQGTKTKLLTRGIEKRHVNVPKGCLIDYQNIDGGDSFKFTLGNNDRIKYFILSVYDQDGKTITDMTDCIIHLQFTINKINNKKHY